MHSLFVEKKEKKREKMKSKGRAKGLGFGYNEVTKDINKVSWAKNKETITINDA